MDVLGGMHHQRISIHSFSTILFGAHSSLITLILISNRHMPQTITAHSVEQVSRLSFHILSRTLVAELREFYYSVVWSRVGVFFKSNLSHQFQYAFPY